MAIAKRKNITTDIYRELANEKQEEKQKILNEYSVEIPMKNIKEGKNIRKQYHNIDELAESIKLYGLIEPIVVYQEDKSSDIYTIISGHRRYKACQKNKAETIKVAILDGDDLTEEKIFLIMIEENVQRDDLDNSEIYESILSLRDQGYSIRDIAKKMCKSPAYIQAYVNIETLNLSVEEINDMNVYKAGRLANKIKDMPEAEKKQELEKVKKTKQGNNDSANTIKKDYGDYTVTIKAKSDKTDVGLLLKQFEAAIEERAEEDRVGE